MNSDLLLQPLRSMLHSIPFQFNSVGAYLAKRLAFGSVEVLLRLSAPVHEFYLPVSFIEVHLGGMVVDVLGDSIKHVFEVSVKVILVSLE
jgi:hypothetical protein